MPARPGQYDVYGIGNALVDIVTEVDAGFFEIHGVEPGVMTLVDDKRQHELVDAIASKNKKMACGGSAANTMIGVAQFGGHAFYSCLVSSDKLGKFFLDDLQRNGVYTNLDHAHCPEGITGKCLVMTTPNADRTLNTFLGVSSFLSADHLDEEAISRSSYVYLEGYLVASPRACDALKEARRLAERAGVPTSLTLSDPSMVRYFSGQMDEVVADGVDLLFCNVEEAMIFTGSENLEEACTRLMKRTKAFALTLGANGALVYDGSEMVRVDPFNVRAVDTNGAGDMFAGAFLFGITHGRTFAEAGRLASLASARVVTQSGPRLAPHQAKQVLADLIA